MQFRKWEKKDFEQMIDLGEKMWKESTYKTISFSRERLQKLGDHLIERPEKGMGFVAIDEDKIIGMIIVHLTKYFFSDDIFCHDLMLFVDPYKRKSIRVPVKLINLATEWAKEKGAKDNTPIDPNKTGSKYFLKLTNN